ncbi:MAG: hypothetical protein JNK78_07470 [Planctomycetes bacterium]|nr:hypothetical protein [Planctomycetota bacterium]
MEQKGDITDAFDDDSLRDSIAKADQTGVWREATGTFTDPKLEGIRKQLAEPERLDYAERRRRDLQRAALAKAAPATRAVSPEPAFDWRETVVATQTPPPPTPNEVLSQLQDRVSGNGPSALPPEIDHPLLGLVRPVLSGFSVFLPISVTTMVFVGARFDLPVRGLVASIGAGIAWHEFHAGRFRAPLIGLAVYLLAFLTTPGPWGNREILACMVGFVMTLLGSGLVGFLRERDAGGSA